MAIGGGLLAPVIGWPKHAASRKGRMNVVGTSQSGETFSHGGHAESKMRNATGRRYGNLLCVIQAP
jgi:hypothetical protein